MSRYFNIFFWEYEFYKPEWLWSLLAVPVVLVLWISLQRKGKGQLRFSRGKEEQLAYSNNAVKYVRWGINTLYGLSLSVLLFTLAEPYHQAIDPPKIDYKNGIDIILSIDASTSMLSQDFDPNRLEVAKKLAQQFVDTRKGDRIGLVIYEGEAYTACPATLDYKILKEQIRTIEPGNLEPGTAVGNGLGVAVTRLRSDSLKSKVIILLTDGSNNSGSIEPLEAAKLAKAKNCKVYTIGVGSTGLAPQPIQTPFGIQYENLPVEIDEVTLKEIANITGGKYFRAKDESGLRSIYDEINRMEKLKQEHQHFGSTPPLTLFPFYIWAMLFALTGWIIQRTKFKLDD